jgi:spore coat polysaccharide biosynthesis protein SpsF
MNDSVLAIVQARSSSTRLPGKVLRDLHGEPMIVRQLERIMRSTRITQVVVATSVEASDDDLAEVLEGRGVVVRRGPLEDVLARFVGVMEEFYPKHVVRLTADCPLTDPGVIDALIDLHVSSGVDYASNVLERTFPHGLDAECVTADALRRLNALQLSEAEREHVTLGIYRRPTQFSLSSLRQKPSQAHLRWTVDYASDLEFAREVYDQLYDSNPGFSQKDVIDLLSQHPGLVYTDPDV